MDITTFLSLLFHGVGENKSFIHTYMCIYTHIGIHAPVQYLH